MVILREHRHPCMLTCAVLIQTLMYTWADEAGIEKNLYERCEVPTRVCSTEEDYTLYNCEAGVTLKFPDNCNRTAELHCVNEVCQPNCVPTESLKYDYKRMMCVARLGQRCSSSQRKCQESAVCAGSPYSFSSSGYCKCSEGTQNVNGTCTRLLVYGKECGSESVPLPQRNCHAEANIHCLAGTCQCATTMKTSAPNLVFIPMSNRCHVRRGQACGSGAPYSIIASDCIPNSYCKYTGRCECLESATLSENGEHCMAKVSGKQCSSDDPHLQCDASVGLECRNGFCVCKEGRIWNTVYHEQNQYGGNNQILGTNYVCHIKVRNSCKSQVTSTSESSVTSNMSSVVEPCVPNAVCLDGKCLCKDGFIETHGTSDYGGWCSLTFGQSCNHSVYTLFECNVEHGLSCVNGKCACADIHFKFNPRTNTCEDLFELKHELSTERSIGDLDRLNSSEQETGYGTTIAIILVLVVVLIAASVFFKNNIRNFIRNF